MIRKICFIAGQNFSGWYKNGRIWLTFALGLVLCLMLSDEMLVRTQTYETSVQIFEPFIWTFGDSQSVLLSTLLLLVLFADMPFIGQTAPYRLVRTTRKIWLAGQVLYVMFSVLLYNLFLLIAESAIVSSWAYVGNVWSETSAAFAYSGEGLSTVPVSLKTMEILHCKIIKEEQFDLPNQGGTRTLLSIIKEKETDKKYPRTYEKIKKKELK